jgi:hypothetical protein
MIGWAFAAMPADKEVGVGAGRAVENLAEDHRRLHYTESYARRLIKASGIKSERKGRYALGCGTIRR